MQAVNTSKPKQTRAMRNGSGVVPAMTHREIANEMGITYARVEQIEKKALKKLKTLLLEQGFDLKAILIVESFEFMVAWDWKEEDFDDWSD